MLLHHQFEVNLTLFIKRKEHDQLLLFNTLRVREKYDHFPLEHLTVSHCFIFGGQDYKEVRLVSNPLCT